MIYIYDNSIIYRDFKFENVLIGMDDLVKIGDFGFVRVYKTFYLEVYFVIFKYEKDEDLLSICVGIIFYVVLEVLKFIRYSKKVDYYSFGVIFVELYYDMGLDILRIMNKLRI